MSDIKAAAELILQTYVTDPELLGLDIKPNMTEQASIDLARHVLAACEAVPVDCVRAALKQLRESLCVLREQLNESSRRIAGDIGELIAAEKELEALPRLASLAQEETK